VDYFSRQRQSLNLENGCATPRYNNVNFVLISRRYPYTLDMIGLTAAKTSTPDPPDGVLRLHPRS